MSHENLMVIHIAIGVFLLFTGVAAISLKKGSKLHRLAGNIFVISMLLIVANGTYLGFFILDYGRSAVILSINNGLIAAYLAATSWLTIKRKENTTGMLDILACGFILSVASLSFYAGWFTPAPDVELEFVLPTVIYNSVAGLLMFFALLDLSVIFRGGIGGKQRIARHLWRMLFSFLIATTILFIANAATFPDSIRAIKVFSIPLLSYAPIAVILVMVFWLIKVLFTKWWRTE